MSEDGVCLVYRRDEEMDMHVLRDYCKVKPIWRACLVDIFWDKFFMFNNMREWPGFDLNSDVTEDSDWSILFGHLLGGILKTHNILLFVGTAFDPEKITQLALLPQTEQLGNGLVH